MLSLRTLITLQRVFHGIGTNHLLMICLVFVITVTGILLAGASSNAIAQRVYVLQLSYLNSAILPKVPPGAWENITLAAFDAVKDTDLVVRVGYFGLCVAYDRRPWNCAGSVANLIPQSRPVDPVEMTTMAENIKNDVLFPGFLLGGAGLALVTTILLSTFPGWHEERDRATGSDIDVKPFPNRAILQTCVACSGLGALFAFASALWQHTAGATAATILEITAVSVVEASVGGVGTALSWLVFFLWMVAFVATGLWLSSIVILDRLTDDDY